MMDFPVSYINYRIIVVYLNILTLHSFLFFFRNENASIGNVPQAAVIPAPQESLIGDLLSMDLTTPAVVPTSVQPPSVDLLASGLDSLMTTSDLPVASTSNTGLLGDIFGFTPTPVSYSPPKILWLPSEKGKGLEIMGTFSRKYVFIENIVHKNNIF